MLNVGDNELDVGDNEDTLSKVAKGRTHAEGTREVTQIH